MVKINYQKELEKTIAGLHGETPSLLLHACCAPCSSYVLEYLSNYFDITIFYYNPNISPSEEYRKRVAEVKRLIAALPVKHPVSFQEGGYDTERFFALARGREDEPEGGERCFACYDLRLREAAQAAKAGGFAYFTTTLSISPYKNAEKLNQIGASLEKEYGVRYLYSDFKKQNGYKRSIELSAEYDLYRQDYCGCVFSKAKHDRRLKVQNFSTLGGEAVENSPI
nr:epoxyqueuosine reductase QueH [uncultured Caproiciproducens sp.]